MAQPELNVYTSHLFCPCTREFRCPEVLEGPVLKREHQTLPSSCLLHVRIFIEQGECDLHMGSRCADLNMPICSTGELPLC